ncbi:MAG TPA: hypothetical protein VIL43_10155 [Burkholderiales bacterium]
MLTTDEAPRPQSAAEPLAAIAPIPPPAAVGSSALPPRHYLAVESYRLYPFTILTKPLFERYAQTIAAPLSDYTFANNFLWLSQRSGFYQIIEDCSCLFSLNGHCLTMQLPPLGPPVRHTQALAACFEIMDRYNPSPYLSAVEYVSAISRICSIPRSG